MMQCLAAIFLLRCLKAKKYYEDSSEDPRKLTETEVFICKLVHHFMRVTYYNTHEVSHLKGTSFPRLIVPTSFNLRQGLGAFVPGVVVLRASLKVEALWEGHTNFAKSQTLNLSYVVMVKSTVEILQKFVAFSEYMNFIRYLINKCQIILFNGRNNVSI